MSEGPTFTIFVFIGHSSEIVLRDTVEDIVVSQPIPAVLRVIFATAAVVLAGLLLMELGPALWPISIVTPFFAVIVFGGLAVLGSLLLVCVIGASETWRIRAGQVEIEQRLLATGQTFIVEPERNDCSIVQATWTDSEPTYHIRVSARPPELAAHDGFIAGLGRSLLMQGRVKQGDCLQSPGFSSQRAAEDALSILCDRPRSPDDG